MLILKASEGEIDKTMDNIRMSLQVFVLTAVVLSGTRPCLGTSVDTEELPWRNKTTHKVQLLTLPPYNGFNVTEVEIALYVNTFGTISEETMQISLDVLTREQWHDPRLNFEAQVGQPGQVTRVELSDEDVTKIWRPNMYFENVKTGNVQDNGVTNQLAHVYSNGTVVHSKRMSLVLNCPMVLYRYPHDSQNCPLRISTFAYTDDVVRFKWRSFDPILFNKNIHLSKFSFNSSPTTSICELKFHTVGEFTCLQTHIHLKREFGYYLLQIYLPTMLIVAVSWFSFYLPVEAVPARVSVGLITVLTLTTESTKARNSLPHVSYITAIDLWMSVTMIFVFSAMLEYAMVCIVHRRSNRPSANISNGTAAHMPTSLSMDEKQVTESSKVVRIGHNTYAMLSDKRIDVTCRVAFPILYIIFQIVYWIYYIVVV